MGDPPFFFWAGLSLRSIEIPPERALQFLPVAVDKSHLITIGERLYSESIELIRELVNNAYDADATEVWVTVSDEAIMGKDNGTGDPIRF